MPNFAKFMVPVCVCIEKSSVPSTIYFEEGFTQISSSKTKLYSLKVSQSEKKSNDRTSNSFRIKKVLGKAASGMLALQLDRGPEKSFVSVPVEHYLNLCNLGNPFELDCVFIYNFKTKEYVLVAKDWVASTSDLELRIKDNLVPSMLVEGDLLYDPFRSAYLWVSQKQSGMLSLKSNKSLSPLKENAEDWHFLEKIEETPLPLSFVNVMNDSFLKTKSYVKGLDDLLFSRSSSWYSAVTDLDTKFDTYTKNTSVYVSIMLSPKTKTNKEAMLQQLELPIAEKTVLEQILANSSKFSHLFLVQTYLPANNPSTWTFELRPYGGTDKGWSLCFENKDKFSDFMSSLQSFFDMVLR